MREEALDARPPARTLPALRMEHLWTLIILAALGMVIALIPTPPNDFWWHLKAGQIIAEQGLPRTNLFAWTLPADTPYIYATWLAEWLFFQLYQLGGLGLVGLARNMLGLAAFALVALDARRRSDSWRLAALAALLAGAMTLNNLIIRTQNWAWLPFALSAVILSGYAEGRTRPRALLALPLLMAFWTNVHGSFVLGVALVGAYAVGETLRRLLRQPRALPWERVRLLWAALAGTVAATLLNPLGPGIFGYVLKLLTDAPSQSLIIEWQPPNTRELVGAIFYLSVLALMAALAFARRKPSATDLLLIAGFLWMAWSGQRYVVWFGMIAMPILAQSLAAPRSPLARPAGRPGNPALNWALAGVLAMGLLLFQPPLKSALPLPATYTDDLADLPGGAGLFTRSTPAAAAEWLRDNPIPGRMFNEMGYGSYLSWALYPQVQTFIDPRVELFPLAQWEDYVAITQARDHNALLIDKYDVAYAMVDIALQPKLSAALASDTRWERVYSDRATEIFRRKS
ncbi:MAG TPA: hypothetical protein VFS21_20790 [Roseiflexaceae bacterium]|nr:hypothetical protein [Roseiflexaceae bacterium]